MEQAKTSLRALLIRSTASNSSKLSSAIAQWRVLSPGLCPQSKAVLAHLEAAQTEADNENRRDTFLWDAFCAACHDD
jgi:cytochrome c553